MRLSKMFLFFCVMMSIVSGREISLEEFLKAVERNSIELIGNKAQYQSQLENQKSLLSWDYPYVETDISVVKNSQGRNEPQTTALLMITPKLPWVSSMLRQSLNIKTIQYKKSYELRKNLAFIAAKRLYLTYSITKEKYNIYIQRENNYRSQLDIAKQKLDAGSMSKKDYINFRNSYLEAKLAKTNVKSTLVNLEKTIDTLIGEYSRDNTGLDSDIEVSGLSFEYVNIQNHIVNKILDESLYVEIIDLLAKDYQTNAKLANRDRLSALEIGAGIENANSSTNLSLKLQIPLPVTPKNTHLKRKYMALQSGALSQSEVTKRNIRIKAESYMEQLKNKQQYIEIQKENIQNKKSLMDMGKIAYDSQKIGLFEYLAYQNSYMDSLITLADAKIDYIDTEALLEETLGKSLIGEK
ncbi:TolC family protein [Helicobacter cappadocius]|uniref:TolC family protein n=1 Tax=Helicobacter cappadocius TaxID=3063998 RepID=A0AA90PJA0_9HELI|nr:MULTISPECIES: TolC family protein [unclassified Helicobacter]MDO7253288.1 TolC family protein [Helicobacter sp. faydin-H75]MDP2539282.1 TolC family protein [Helicobacter sp. faydin-H76]